MPNYQRTANNSRRAAAPTRPTPRQEAPAPLPYTIVGPGVSVIRGCPEVCYNTVVLLDARSVFIASRVVHSVETQIAAIEELRALVRSR
jgi:hypothetical protein